MCTSAVMLLFQSFISRQSSEYDTPGWVVCLIGRKMLKIENSNIILRHHGLLRLSPGVAKLKNECPPGTRTGLFYPPV